MTATAEQAIQTTAKPDTFQLIDPEKQLEWVNGHAEVKEMAGARMPDVSFVAARIPPEGDQ